MVRAPVVAAWLRQLGHDASVIDGGVAAARAATWPRSAPVVPARLSTVSPAEAAAVFSKGTSRAIDLRAAMTFRKGHVAGSVWSIRSRIGEAADRAKSVVLISDDPDAAALAALDLAETGCRDIRLLAGGLDAWRDAGLPVEASPDNPPDAECIDFLFFTARRHDNDAEAARQYLTWETGLLAQLDAQERGVFRIA
jgi:3-mercaptopyruvate sulfurtransferase SseA